jgi:hypothetical protein
MVLVRQKSRSVFSGRKKERKKEGKDKYASFKLYYTSKMGKRIFIGVFRPTLYPIIE